MILIRIRSSVLLQCSKGLRKCHLNTLETSFLDNRWNIFHCIIGMPLKKFRISHFAMVGGHKPDWTIQKKICIFFWLCSSDVWNALWMYWNSCSDDPDTPSWTQLRRMCRDPSDSPRVRSEQADFECSRRRQSPRFVQSLISPWPSPLRCP